MRIKRVECDQFAGLLDKDIEFDDGLNIVVGDNESGKSTMIDLIYQLLFKDIKLDGRTDSEFIDHYFPKKVSGPQADVIDGVLVFETENGKYKIKKEWEKGEGTCRLTLPDGTSIKGSDAINKVLTDELKHRAGVYSEIVFASQKRNQIAIESIMKSLGKKANSLSDVRADLTSTLTQAALETGGVSLDKIEKLLKSNLNELIGHWDFDADAPEGGPKRESFKNQWKNGAGSIVKAYYEVDEIRAMQSDAENAERALEEATLGVKQIKIQLENAQEKREAFQKYRGILGQQVLLEKSILDLNNRVKEQEIACKNWPELIEKIKQASRLNEKLQMSMIHTLYEKARVAQKAYQEAAERMKALKPVDSQDVSKLRDLNSQKVKLESKLAGMNLVAKIKQLGKTEVEVRSAVTGELLSLENDEAKITEAVDIVIPGIMEMQLMPQGVDVTEIKTLIAKVEEEVNSLHEKYNITSLDELQEKASQYVEKLQELEKYRIDLEKILGDGDWENLKEANSHVPEDIETEEVLKEHVAVLCEGKTVEAFMAAKEAIVADYERKYESVEKLKQSIEAINDELTKNRELLHSLGAVPEEYRDISNPEAHDKMLLEKIDELTKQVEMQNQKVRDAERNLGNKSAEEYYDELQEKESIFVAKKAEYEHWKNIYNVFCRMKEETGGNPIEDIAEKFRAYLEIITDGAIHLCDMDETLSVWLANGSHALTYEILSDGTKDTISLAFRLAMLEHLYPNGNGLAVFDDPFTDMDAKRVEKSCKLIQKFAENNQVIFVTCDDKYKNNMAGNVISVVA